ncbi:hypothetical protein [Actinophytocola sp.]|uniref:hypothetical protein n=1 Tax=Actinophytocola sp. TaxID=1872138 RepID=UPI002D7EB624|nr:hypothetical protein [Actinophytocola sp.]HET9144169.1 hypothetical protein [Actinophytocola sp.]
MSVTITAKQARPGDIVSDRRGSLWRRQDFHAAFELTHLASGVTVAEYGIDSDDEHEISVPNLDFYSPLTLLMREGKPVGDELPPEPAPPKIVEFEWALHGGSPYEERESWERELGFKLTDDLLDKMGRPFYEVILRCSLDTETGKVEILEAK